jgi:hypothetical protein
MEVIFENVEQHEKGGGVKKQHYDLQKAKEVNID